MTAPGFPLPETDWAPTAPFWLNMLQRKRARPRMPNEKSSSLVSSKRFFCASVSTL